MKLRENIRDIKIVPSKLNNIFFYDIAIENLNIIEEDNSNTPIINSITESKKQTYDLHADFPSSKRGGSYFYDIFRGSLLWLKEKSTNSLNDTNEIKTYILKSLEWLKEEGFVNEVNIKSYVFNHITRSAVVEISFLIGTQQYIKKYEL